jgi:hypothetical protein
MKQTAVEWLVDKILTKDEIYDDYGNLIGYKLINTFTSSVDLTEYVNEAKEMEYEKEKIENAADLYPCSDAIPYYDENETFKQQEQ